MTLLYVGAENCILTARLDTTTSLGPQLTILERTEIGAMPSYLCFAKKQPRVLAVVEGEDQLAMLHITETGSLQLETRVACPGGPAYISLDQSENFALTASYGSGETRVFPLGPQGELGEASSTVTTGKYTHCALASSNNERIFATSKGTDKIAILNFDQKSGTATELTTVETSAGCGPRHIVFSSDHTRAYVACENGCSLIVYSVEGDSLVEMAQTSTLPRPQQEGDTGSDVHISSDDKFIYVSNRGHDSIAIFRTTAKGVELIGHESTRGEVPRHFNLLGEEMLVAANQESSSLSFFKRDSNTGTLNFLGLCDLPERPFWVGNRESR